MTTAASGSDVARTRTTRSRRQAGKASSQIKHVIFINKENATHDLMLGDITSTRRGVPVDGEPSFSLGYDASPNHHELALRFAFSDNFFLGAVGVLGRPSLADRPVHRGVRGDPLARLLRRQAQTTGDDPRSSGTIRVVSASPTPTRRPSRTITTSTAGSTST